MDDMDTTSRQSIGIVENPLYAEDEGGLQYSSGPAIDKDAEVCTVILIHLPLVMFTLLPGILLYITIASVMISQYSHMDARAQS